MTEIGIVGAGVAGAGAAFALDRRLPDATLTVLEQSGSVGGRAATRQRAGCTYEYGANYVKSDDERVAALLTETLETDGLVDVTDPIYTFDESGTVTPGREADEHKWTYRTGISQVATRLFERTDATVHLQTRVESVERLDGSVEQLSGSVDQSSGSAEGASIEGTSAEGTPADSTGTEEPATADVDGRWQLRDDEGERWGPFDALVLTPPAPQTAALLDAAAWEHPARAALAEAAAEIPYRTIWTAVLHYEFELDVPYYALVNTDREHEVGWIGREECKPGHVPEGESLLVVQAAPTWSADRVDDPPREIVAALADHAADLLGDERLREPDWTDHECWRYALPDEGLDAGALEGAAAEGLYCAGDWVAGEARLHAALASGLDAGERIADGQN